MSVDLNIWSNHNLKFNSLKEGMDAFEQMTSQKIVHWNFKTDEPLERTSNISSVEYFTNFEILDYNFNQWNSIRIWTNYYCCNELTLYNQTIKIHPTNFRTRYSRWKELVANKYDADGWLDPSDFEESRKNWIGFRNYVHQIVRTLHGTRVIYFNDNSYQNEEDLYYQGGSLEDGIAVLDKIVKPMELEYLQLFPDNMKVQTAWYYEDL